MAGELDTLTEVERIILRQAVQDHGPAIWHGPMTRGSVDNVGRYLTEGGNLLPAHDWRFVWRCVVELLEREPDLVTGPVPTQGQLAERRRDRVGMAEAHLVEALTAFKAAEWPAARAWIDLAEQEAPLHRSRGRSYADLRAFVDNERELARALLAWWHGLTDEERALTGVEVPAG